MAALLLATSLLDFRLSAWRVLFRRVLNVGYFNSPDRTRIQTSE